MTDSKHVKTARTASDASEPMSAMIKVIVGACLLAIAAGLVWTHAGTLGLQAAWPVFIGMGLVPMTMRRERLAPIALGTACGVGVGWLMFALITQYFPFLPIVFGVGAGSAIAVMGITGSLFQRRLSLSAMFIGFGVFIGLYEPTWIVNRAAFLTDGAAAVATVLVAMAGAMLLSIATGFVLKVSPAVELAAGPAIEHRARTERRTDIERRVAKMADYTGYERRSVEKRSGTDRRQVASRLVALPLVA